MKELELNKIYTKIDTSLFGRFSKKGNIKGILNKLLTVIKKAVNSIFKLLNRLTSRLLSFLVAQLRSCVSRPVFGFTLAEVLIVIGILGVVAAMTIPSLVENVQKQQYVTQLKKFYTTMDNGFTQMLAADGVELLGDTTVFSSLGGYCYTNGLTTSSCQDFGNGLHKYFKFTVVMSPSDYVIKRLGDSGSDDWGNIFWMVLSDGAVIRPNYFSKTAETGDAATIRAAGEHMFSYQHGGDIYVDVNGFKGPNTWGRDVFWFVLSGDGKLYPYEGRDWSIFRSGNLSETWQHKDACGISDDSTDVSDSWGYGCAARIIEDGWQMKY